MSKKLLPPLLEDLLNSVNGPPTEAYLAEIEDAAKAIKRVEHLLEKNRKPRPSARKDELQNWINKSVARCPDLKAEDRYNSAPPWVQKEVGIGRFSKRVGDAKKLIASAKQ